MSRPPLSHSNEAHGTSSHQLKRLQKSKLIQAYYVACNVDLSARVYKSSKDPSLPQLHPSAICSDILYIPCKAVASAHISLAVSMLSQLNAVPTKGVETAIRYLAGYLNAFRLSGVRLNCADVIDSYTHCENQ